MYGFNQVVDLHWVDADRIHLHLVEVPKNPPGIRTVTAVEELDRCGLIKSTPLVTRR